MSMLREYPDAFEFQRDSAVTRLSSAAKAGIQIYLMLLFVTNDRTSDSSALLFPSLEPERRQMKLVKNARLDESLVKQSRAIPLFSWPSYAVTGTAGRNPTAPPYATRQAPVVGVSFRKKLRV